MVERIRTMSILRQWRSGVVKERKIKGEPMCQQASVGVVMGVDDDG